MRRVPAVLVLLSACAADPVAPPSSPSWHELSSAVKAGMARQQVEVILPRHSLSPVDTRIVGEEVIVSYWVDDHWKVTIGYDATGCARREDGRLIWSASPENRVTDPPRFARLERPRVEDWNSKF